MSQDVLQQKSFHFSLGRLDCFIFLDTISPMKLEDFFPINLMEYLQQVSDQYNVAPAGSFQTMCLVLRSGQHTILVDTGTGDRFPPETGQLVHNMQAEGIKRTDVDRVIITHAHPDHVGGNVDSDGQPMFPNARFTICRKEWEFWETGGDLSRVEERFRQHMLDTVRRELFPLRDKFDLVDVDTEFMPGMKFIKAFGHSAGHVILNVSSGTDRLLCTADLFHHPLLLVKPGLPIPLDTDPEQAGRTRTLILSELISPDLLVFANHFPFPGLGHIVPRLDGWVWERNIF